MVAAGLGRIGSANALFGVASNTGSDFAGLAVSVAAADAKPRTVGEDCAFGSSTLGLVVSRPGKGDRGDSGALSSTGLAISTGLASSASLASTNFATGLATGSTGLAATSTGLAATSTGLAATSTGLAVSARLASTTFVTGVVTASSSNFASARCAAIFAAIFASMGRSSAFGDSGSAGLAGKIGGSGAPSEGSVSPSLAGLPGSSRLVGAARPIGGVINVIFGRFCGLPSSAMCSAIRSSVSA